MLWWQVLRCDVLRPDLQEEIGQARGASHRNLVIYLALWSAEVGPLAGTGIGGSTNAAKGMG